MTYSFSYLEPVCCSMSSSNCCFLTLDPLNICQIFIELLQFATRSDGLKILQGPRVTSLPPESSHSRGRQGWSEALHLCKDLGPRWPLQQGLKSGTPPLSGNPLRGVGDPSSKCSCLWEATEVTPLTVGTPGPGQLCDFPRFVAELALNPSP